MNAQPFKVTIPQEVLDNLQQRLQGTRWIDGAAVGWEFGTSLDYLKELVNYWQTQFDWRRQEAAINLFSQFRVEIDGFGIHFVHEHGKGPDPFPILLTHGYPDSFLRFAKIIPMLTDPVKFGGNPADAFHVVAPSLPGYGFSDKPSKSGMIFHVADFWNKLMQQLGYKHFAAHGGDWGSTVTEHLARSHSDAVVGIHLTDVPFAHIFQKPDDLSSHEKKYLAETEEWQKKSGAYAMIQGTRPQSLAHGLNDSPAGLAAW